MYTLCAGFFDLVLKTKPLETSVLKIKPLIEYFAKRKYRELKL